MGSARVSNVKPIPMENTDKKTLKTLIKSIFHKKKDKTKNEKKDNATEPKEKINEKESNEKIIDTRNSESKNNDTVANILDTFKNLDLNLNEGDDDELEIITIKVVEDKERMQSQSSQDSGFSDIKDDYKFETTEGNKDDKDANETLDKTKDVIEGLEKLQLNDKKAKKIQNVLVPRGPTKFKVCNFRSPAGPYPDADRFREIRQVNKHTLTGGQVTVNQQHQDTLTEVDIALKHVENQSQYYQKNQEGYLDMVLELIEGECPEGFAQIPTPEYSLPDEIEDQDAFINNLLEQPITKTNCFEENELNTFLFSDNTGSNDSSNKDYIFPTPPRSENIPSPTESPFYPSNSEYTLSPERSPIYHSDYEKYQEIPHFDDEKERKRSNSMSSMTMKQFKDLQKEIVANLAKKECCQVNRSSCKEIFQSHLQKLKMAERKNLCFKVAKLDLNTAFGVLHNIILTLLKGAEQEDVQYALFGLVCGRILSHDSSLFISDAGLSVLKSAALRCSGRPILTRHLVQCMRAALRADPSLAQDKNAVFHEVDPLGDNLVIACAREGDRCADVLAELVRAEPGQPALFRTQHANADGYTALHLACSQHAPTASRLHTVHALLEHAGADIWKGDVKGGESALHLAVNSSTCDLHLVMLLFKHVDRKMWKSLAHCQNMSSVTPIEYARSATKSTTRQNYPHEILEFLKKCR